MDDDALHAYIETERTRGVSNDALRSELLSKGWDNGRVASALGTPPGAVSVDGIFGSDMFTRRAVFAGLVFMLFSTALLYASHEVPNITLDEQIVFGFFLLTHIVNIVGCSSLALALFRRSARTAYRVFLFACGLSVIVFAVPSVIHFFSITSGFPLFELITKPLGAEGALLFVYFFLLPLQVIVYLILAVVLACVRYFKKRRGEDFPVRAEMVPLLIFLLIALIGIGDFVIVLNSGF